VGLRPPDVPAHVLACTGRGRGGFGRFRGLRLDQEGAPVGPTDIARSGRHFLGGAAALDACACADRRSSPSNLDEGDHSRLGRGYAVEVGHLGISDPRLPGQGHAGVSAAWRLLHGATDSTGRKSGRSLREHCSAYFPDRPIVENDRRTHL